MVLKPPGAAQTPKTTDFQPNPKLPSAKPPSGNRRLAWKPAVSFAPPAVSACAARARPVERAPALINLTAEAPLTNNHVDARKSEIICLHMGVALTGGARLRGKIQDFGGLGSPGPPGDPSKRWGVSPPTFFRGFPAARGRPDHQNPGFSLLIWPPPPLVPLPCASRLTRLTLGGSVSAMENMQRRLGPAPG